MPFCMEWKWRLSDPDTRLRRHSWDFLHQIGGSVHGPQLVEGDFNEILKGMSTLVGDSDPCRR